MVVKFVTELFDEEHLAYRIALEALNQDRFRQASNEFESAFRLRAASVGIVDQRKGAVERGGLGVRSKLYSPVLMSTRLHEG